MIRVFMIVLVSAIALSGATVKGTVHDSVTGEPLSGASVSLMLWSARTAPDGTFEIQNVKPGKHSLQVSHPGHVPIQRHPWYGPFVEVPPEGDVKPIAVRLEPAASIRGTVRSETGEPIPKAKVFGPHEHRLEAETGLDGRFVLDAVPSGKVKLQVEVPPAVRAILGVAADAAFASELVVTPGQNLEGIDIRVPLSRTVTVSGTVVDPGTGDPVTQGEIELQSAAQGDYRARQERRGLEQGTFRFDGVRPGPYHLVVWRGSGRLAYSTPPFLHPIEVGADGVANYKVPLPPTARLTGTVKHPPIAGFDFHLSFSPKNMMSGNSTPIDANGRFQVDGLSPGIWRVGFSFQRRPLDGFATGEFPSLRLASMRQTGRELKSGRGTFAEIEIFAGENPEIEIEFAVQPRIRGIVVDKDGNAVPKATVSMVRDKRPAMTWSVSDGTFSMGLEPGTYEVKATAPGSSDETKCESAPVTVRMGESDVSGIRLVLCP